MKRAANKPVVPSLALLGGRFSRMPAAFVAVLGCAAGLAGCTPQPPGTSERMPYRDDWKVAVDAPFVHTSLNEDGNPVPDITNVIIGGREDGDNFANRGDVIVTFDGPPNRIRVEMRRFTFSTTEEGAQADFDDLSLWAYAASVSAQEQDPADDCSESWQNQCEARVYFDGLSQLERSGADLRVTLPPEYRQNIKVVTQDNIEEEDYLNRGNVCVSNLFATAEIETESGQVWASLARDVTPAPKCSQEQITKCENWTVTDDMGNETPAAWAPECDCIAQNGEFGRLAVTSRDETAADITIDMPEGLWVSVKAENQGEGQEQSGDHCEATIEVANFVPGETGNDFPWQANGDVNFPGTPAFRGAGYTVQAVSSSCEPVAYTENPSDFVGTGNGEEQASEERGNVTICNNCITQSCNELIP